MGTSPQISAIQAFPEQQAQWNRHNNPYSTPRLAIYTSRSQLFLLPGVRPAMRGEAHNPSQQPHHWKHPLGAGLARTRFRCSWGTAVWILRPLFAPLLLGDGLRLVLGNRLRERRRERGNLGGRLRRWSGIFFLRTLEGGMGKWGLTSTVLGAIVMIIRRW